MFRVVDMCGMIRDIFTESEWIIFGITIIISFMCLQVIFMMIFIFFIKIDISISISRC